jgi:hypothetical protein
MLRFSPVVCLTNCFTIKRTIPMNQRKTLAVTVDGRDPDWYIDVSETIVHYRKCSLFGGNRLKIPPKLSTAQAGPVTNEQCSWAQKWLFNTSFEYTTLRGKHVLTETWCQAAHVGHSALSAAPVTPTED